MANKFRDELGSEPWQIGKDGCVRPLEKPGIGVEIDEKFLAAHPVIERPGSNVHERHGQQLLGIFMAIWPV